MTPAIEKKQAESMYGEEIDIDELLEMSGWVAFHEKVKIIGKHGRVVATVPIDTLIECWIEKEKEAYQEVLKKEMLE